MRTERDFENQLAYARKEGREVGREEGVAEGEARGRAEGEAKGREAGLAEGRTRLIESARTMLEAGLSMEKVLSVTGLNPADIGR